MQHFLKNWHWKSPPKYRNKLRFICEVLPFFNAAASRCQGILSHVLNFQKRFHRLEGRDLMVSHKVLLQCNEILLLIFFKPSQTKKKKPHETYGLYLNQLTAFEMFWWEWLFDFSKNTDINVTISPLFSFYHFLESWLFFIYSISLLNHRD